MSGFIRGNSFVASDKSFASPTTFIIFPASSNSFKPFRKIRKFPTISILIAFLESITSSLFFKSYKLGIQIAELIKRSFDKVIFENRKSINQIFQILLDRQFVQQILKLIFEPLTIITETDKGEVLEEFNFFRTKKISLFRK